jgi:hypothetical protein
MLNKVVEKAEEVEALRAQVADVRAATSRAVEAAQQGKPARRPSLCRSSGDAAARSGPTRAEGGGGPLAGTGRQAPR